MQFDDHEIWGAPVHTAEPEAVPAEEAAAKAPAPTGRLYRSAGCEDPTEAVVALPGHHRRHTAAHAEPTIRPAVSISSFIPRTPVIDDPAIAEVLAPAVPAATTAPAELDRAHAWANPAVEHSGFTSWFRRSGAVDGVPGAPGRAPASTTAPAATAQRADAVASARGALSRLVGRSLGTPGYALGVFVVTVIVGIVNAKSAGTLGFATGLVFLVASTVGAWLLDDASRWSGWALPSYTLIASVLVAGQFENGAPGLSILGQVVLVFASLITLAPWLAASAIVGALIPRLRASRA